MEDHSAITRDIPARLNLLYTVGFDPPGARLTRQMVKMLAGSVVRTFFTGDMVMVRNSSQPVFMVQRAGIEECCVETPTLDAAAMADCARAFKAEARHHLPAAENYEWVVFLDADCLCLRNIDHLMQEREGVDILFQPEPGRNRREAAFCGYLTEDEMGREKIQNPESKIQIGCQPGKPDPDGVPDGGTRVPPREWGVNSGTWAVRGRCYRAVMEEWARIHATEPVRPAKCREQGAWNRLIIDAAQHGWRAEAFEPHEIQFPLHLDRDWRLYKDAAIAHCTGATNLEKIEFMFGLYMQRFFYDPACTLLNVVEM